MAHAQKAKLSPSHAAEWIHPCCLLGETPGMQGFSLQELAPVRTVLLSENTIYYMNGCGPALRCDSLAVSGGMQSNFLWFLPALCKNSKTLDNTILATRQKKCGWRSVMFKFYVFWHVFAIVVLCPWDILGWVFLWKCKIWFWRQYKSICYLSAVMLIAYFKRDWLNTNQVLTNQDATVSVLCD